MDANEFWCRAFLVAMGDYVDDPGACEDAANAALAVAQRRGMVATEDLAPLRRAAIRWIAAARANNADDFDAADAELVKAAEALAGDPAPGPELERVEFRASPADHGQWALTADELGGSVLVARGREAFDCNGRVVRIKWGETAPPKPIEVWIEKAGR